MEPPTEGQQEKAGQTKPPGLFYLPGVESRDADEEREAHGKLQGDYDRPCPGGGVKASTSFLGEEAKRVLRVGVENAPERPERRAKMILAKKRRCGAFREPNLEFTALVGGLEGEEAS